MEKINSKEEWLAIVKEEPSQLSCVHDQTFEICKTAVLSQDEEDRGDILKYVDPELRTTALLEAVGINANGYED